MSKIQLREEVIKLRLSGFTYGQIKKELGVSKSTLSDWLSDLPLTEEQLQKLAVNRKNSRDIRVEKFRETYKNKRNARLQKIFKEQSSELLPLSDRELLIAGIFLYWGEGEKKRGRVAISNTDPRIVKFTYYWITNILKISREKIKFSLHLYKDMDISETTKFWTKFLDVPITQFNKPYIKNSNREGLTYKGYGHGTCRILAGNTELSERIAMSIKAISEFYGEKSELFWYN